MKYTSKILLSFGLFIATFIPLNAMERFLAPASVALEVWRQFPEESELERLADLSVEDRLLEVHEALKKEVQIPPAYQNLLTQFITEERENARAEQEFDDARVQRFLTLARENPQALTTWKNIDYEHENLYVRFANDYAAYSAGMRLLHSLFRLRSFGLTLLEAGSYDDINLGKAIIPKIPRLLPEDTQDLMDQLKRRTLDLENGQKDIRAYEEKLAQTPTKPIAPEAIKKAEPSAKQALETLEEQANTAVQLRLAPYRKQIEEYSLEMNQFPDLEKKYQPLIEGIIDLYNDTRRFNFLSDVKLYLKGKNDAAYRAAIFKQLQLTSEQQLDEEIEKIYLNTLKIKMKNQKREAIIRVLKLAKKYPAETAFLKGLYQKYKGLFEEDK